MAFMHACSGLLLLAAARGLSWDDPAMDAASLVQVLAKSGRGKPLGVDFSESQMGEAQMLAEAVIGIALENSSDDAASNDTAGKEMSMHRSWVPSMLGNGTNGTRKFLEGNGTRAARTAMSHDVIRLFVNTQATFTQYQPAVIISNVFSHFDADGDDRLNTKELADVLTYFYGPTPSWRTSSDADRQKTLLAALDHVVPDGKIQPSEFFFWFTWPHMDQPMDLVFKLKEMRERAMEERKHHNWVTGPKSTAEEMDIPLLPSSDIPEDSADVTKLFGNLTQFQEVVRILFFYRTFDTNMDHKLDSVEMTDMMEFLEPASWTPREIVALVACLDMITQDKTVELNEFFYWFTPSFTTVWEPAIHTSHPKKQEEPAIHTSHPKKQEDREIAAYKQVPQAK